ncbi:hypothetical protein GCM10027447_12210 [Glycomyces halotolerans]
MTPSVRGAPDAEQQALLGELHPTPGVRLTLHRTDRPGEAILIRHRTNPHTGPEADTAARIRYHGAVVSRIEWDEHHRSHRIVWMGMVEDWIRAQIAGAS